MSETYYIGWDVGAWSCSEKSKSCDAVVILDETKNLVGRHRGSIKQTINSSENTKYFLTDLFRLCNLDYNEQYVILAIDTPLGYSETFLNLISFNSPSNEKFDKYSDNSYLFRRTEQHVFSKQITNASGKFIRPLSSVNDRIGSQSTKGIHVISKFARNIIDTGVWSDSDKLTVIETYPSINREIKVPRTLNEEHVDIKDAYICAEIAYAFKNDKSESGLVKPTKEIPEREGWIWYLKK